MCTDLVNYRGDPKVDGRVLLNLILNNYSVWVCVDPPNWLWIGSTVQRL